MTPFAITKITDDFASFALKQLRKSGWQGRLTQRWNSEMADLVLHQKEADIDDVTARNYVYMYRTKLKDALDALPPKDRRRKHEAYLDGLLATPEAFLTRGRRVELEVTYRILRGMPYRGPLAVGGDGNVISRTAGR